ncbi:hypothetical protein D3C79_1078430 [compost metagenome]
MNLIEEFDGEGLEDKEQVAVLPQEDYTHLPKPMMRNIIKRNVDKVLSKDLENNKELQK